MSKKTIALVPGFPPIMWGMKRFGKIIETAGFKFFTRRILPTADTSLNRDKLADIFYDTPQAYQKALAFLNELGQADISRVDYLFCYSEGVLPGIIAAYIQPKLFRHLVLICPAGIIRQNIFTYFFKIWIETIKYVFKPQYWHYLFMVEMEICLSLITRPLFFFRTIKEILTFNTYWHLRTLEEIGIKTTVFAAEKDSIIPPKQLQNTAEVRINKFLSNSSGGIETNFAKYWLGHNGFTSEKKGLDRERKHRQIKILPKTSHFCLITAPEKMVKEILANMG